MGKKQVMYLVVLVALAFSAISIADIASGYAIKNFNSFTEQNKCKAQGDFEPRPFKPAMIASTSNDAVCSAQGDIKPRPWVDEDKDGIDDRTQFSSAQGDIKPRPWVDEDKDGIDDRTQLTG